MKVDIGFWDINGNYITDIQEIGAEEMDKNFNEFFDKLNDMANFKNFGEKEESEENVIIINGVDVTGCCYYESKNDTGKWCDITCTKEHTPYFRCESMPNCYYKQLKRLEQENDKLKKENKVNLSRSLDLNREIQNLSDENSRLKNERTVDLVRQIDELKVENDELKHSNENLRLALKTYEMPEVVKVLTDWRTGELDLRINKYKHTLQEIKAIAENAYCLTNYTNKDMANFAKQILCLITKAEEER